MGSVGESGNPRSKGRNNAVRVLCSLLASERWTGERGERGRGGGGGEGYDKREKDVKRVVKQGGTALLVHGALPRKPLFVLHPFARARQATRENEGTRKGRWRGKR